MGVVEQNPRVLRYNTVFFRHGGTSGCVIYWSSVLHMGAMPGIFPRLQTRGRCRGLPCFRQGGRWEQAQSLCLAFGNCTESGPPSGSICPDCVSGETACPMRDCHEAKKCEGHFIDSYSMEDVEECIVTCNENDDCNWYTLEKQHDHCILYEDCDKHDDTCETCATGPKYCANGYHSESGMYFTQQALKDLMDGYPSRLQCIPIVRMQRCGIYSSCYHAAEFIHHITMQPSLSLSTL